MLTVLCSPSLGLKPEPLCLHAASVCANEARARARSKRAVRPVRTVITEARREQFPSQNGHGGERVVRRRGGRDGKWGNSQATTPFFLPRKGEKDGVICVSIVARGRAERLPFLPSPFPSVRANEKASENGACFVSGERRYRTVSDCNLKEAECQEHPRKTSSSPLPPPLPRHLWPRVFFSRSTPVKIVLYDFWKLAARSGAELPRGDLPRVSRRTVTRPFEGGTHCCTLIERARPGLDINGNRS